MKLTKRIFQFQLFSILCAMIVAAIIYSVSLSILTHLSIKTISSSTIEQSIERQRFINELTLKVEDKPLESFNNPLFIGSLTSSLDLLKGEFLLLQNRNLIASSTDFSRAEITDIWNKIDQPDAAIRAGKQTYKLASLRLADSFLVILWPNDTVKLVAWLPATLALLTFLIVYILISGWISAKITREIVKPIEQLKQSALQISNGELDSIIPEDANGELLELCRALEQMRVKLKESIYLQQKYDENRSFLISSISHDLRTPVTSIKGYIEGILDGVANTPEKQKQYLLTAQRKAALMNTMIEDLLLYSKLDLNQMPFNVKPVDFAAYVEHCVEENQALLEQQNVIVSLQADPISNRMVLLDAERFMRVFQNIIDNAIFYNDSNQPTITFMLRETYTSIILEIKDNGIGIKADEADHIFDRFYRSDRARKVESGSGLGLAIAKQIIEAHNGQIWASSQLNMGTSIFISLPKRREVN
ncbi:sensor histidine kinase [Paenibacillus septentrionalis]|uniref:histidine kinase n=1 Tax=Paenibacillus septentrionalis TaxID=429342 RepID=A0ABW1V3A6_9BACL